MRKKPEKTRRRRDEAHVASTRRVRFAASGKPHHMLARLPRAHREHSTSHRTGVRSVPPPRSICCSPVLHGRLLADEENNLEHHGDMVTNIFHSGLRARAPERHRHKPKRHGDRLSPRLQIDSRSFVCGRLAAML